MNQAPDRTSPPPCWLLLGDKGGDNAQLRALAQEAGLPAVEIQLEPLRWSWLPNLIRGTSGLGMQANAALAPPWPKLILASGRHGAAVALWIKRRSGGRSKLVHVGRPWAPLGWFDLVLSPPQYQLPARANVMACAAPFNRITAGRLSGEAARWAPRWAHLPRPWLALIVGGSARPLLLDGPLAARIGKQANALARATGGSLLVSTSRRTPPAAADALMAAIDAPNFCFRWRADAPAEENPYAGMLALADRLIVTGDSASMLAEALRTGKPVTVAPLEFRPDWRRRIADNFARAAPQALVQALIGAGLLNSTRDLRRLIDPLRRAGVVSGLDDPSDPAHAFIDDFPAAVSAVRAVFNS